MGDERMFFLADVSLLIRYWSLIAIAVGVGGVERSLDVAGV